MASSVSDAADKLIDDIQRDKNRATGALQDFKSFLDWLPPRTPARQESRPDDSGYLQRVAYANEQFRKLAERKSMGIKGKPGVKRKAKRVARKSNRKVSR